MKGALRGSAGFAVLCVLFGAGLFAQCPSGNPPIVTVTSGTTSAQSTNCLQTSGTVTISSSSTVVFEGGAAVYLLPGFSAQAGSSGTAFIAKIGPAITTTSLPPGVAGAAYVATVSAMEGTLTGPFSWSWSGVSGLTLNATTGGISGAPASAGTFNVNVTATDTSSGSSSLVMGLTLIVSQAAQTITFNAPGNAVYGAAPFTASATASSNLAVSFASNTTPVCTVSGTAVALIAAGACSITASQAGNANYAAATPVTQSFSVTQAAQTITFNTAGSFVFGEAPFTVNATASSGLAVTFSSTTSGECAVSGATVIIVGAGTCSVTASQAGNADYSSAPNVTQNFGVSQAAQTIVFNAPGSVTFGAAPFTVGATATSGLGVTFASTTNAVCTVSGTTVTIAGAGACFITASQAGSTNYSSAPSVTQGFAVNQATQTISFNSPGNVLYGAEPFSLSATSTSGLSVTLASTTSGVCSVSGATVAVVGGGTCSLTASQAGNTNYVAASSVTQSFTVNQATQAITFNAPGGTPLSNGTVPLTATSTSGLTVSFASNSTGVCTVSGSTVTLAAAGSCSITASQAGNTGYLSAPPNAQSFSVTDFDPRSRTPAPDTLSINGDAGTVEIPQNVTVPFIFTYHDNNGASGIWWAQFALLSGNSYLCEGDWGQPNALELYDGTYNGNSGAAYGFGNTFVDSYCTVSLVSLAPSSTDSTAMVVGLNFSFKPGFAGTYSVVTQVNYVDGTPAGNWETLGTVIIDPTPGVTLTDNTTGATLTGGSYFAGDSFTLTVSGLANQPVNVVLDGFPYGQVGTTNASGQFTTSNSWDLSNVGYHTETWSVGDATSTITFYVNQPFTVGGVTNPTQPVVTSGSTITVTVPFTLGNGFTISSALSFGNSSCSDSYGDSFALSNVLVSQGQLYYISVGLGVPVGIPAGPYGCVIAAVYASLTIPFQFQVTVAAPCAPQILGLQVNGQSTNTILDGTSGYITISGTCLNGSTPTVQVDGTGIQITSVSIASPTQVTVSYQASGTATGGTHHLTVTTSGGSPSVPVFATSVTLLSFSFATGDNTGGVAYWRDCFGNATPIALPTWPATNVVPGSNPPTPVACPQELGYQGDHAIYASGSTMAGAVTFGLNPAPQQAVAGVYVQGTTSGFGTFSASNVTIPAGSATFQASVTDNTALAASTTQFINPLSIAWSVGPSGTSCTGCVAVGSSSNPVYVTLAASVLPAKFGPTMLTYASLAVGAGGATTQNAALANTWAQFSTGSGPANVTTWDGRPMQYYSSGFNTCALNSANIVQNLPTSSAQCGAFALLLESALAMNGIHSNWVQVQATDWSPNVGSKMVIKNWQLSPTPTYASLAPSPWQYFFTLNAQSTGDYMVPSSSNMHGDLTNVTGVAAQGVIRPAEKVFDSHFIVQIVGSVTNWQPCDAGSSQIYDPSYGLIYTSAANFESQSISGYAAQNNGDPIGGTNYHFRVPILGAPNISFGCNAGQSMWFMRTYTMGIRVFLTVLSFIPLLAQQSVSPVGFSGSRQAIRAFNAGGEITLPTSRLQLDITYPGGRNERGDLLVVYDPQTGHYLWRYNPFHTPGETLSFLSGFNSSGEAVYADPAALVDFLMTQFYVTAHTTQADSLDAAEQAAIDEIQKGLPVFEKRGYHTDQKSVPIFGAIGRQFRCPPVSPVCNDVDQIVSINRPGNNWRLVLRNRFDVEVILDEKFNLVSTRRLTEPPEGANTPTEFRVRGAEQ